MKRFILYSLLLILSTLAINSQNIIFTEKDIIGRWIEIERTEGDQTSEITTNNDTYIFRDNHIYHKGEASEGLILFNIAGKYSVEENTIVITYKDYMDKTAKDQKPKSIKFEVLSIDKNKNEMIVSIQDYDYEYQMKLKRQ